MQSNRINNNLLKALIALNEIYEVNILDQWRWDAELKKWYINICININSNNRGKISDNSLWYVVVDDDYPEGVIKIYPDSKGDFTETFNHQSNNGEIEINGKWRKGSLCLESPLKSLGKYDHYTEPTDANYRLCWNVKRAINWIHAVNDDILVSNGDPFELPEFNINLSNKFVFLENEDSFKDWQNTAEKYGVLGIGTLDNKPTTYFVKEFRKGNNNILKKVIWGKFLSENSKKPRKNLLTGLWVLLKKPPVINHWQAPNNYGELFKACEEQNINLKRIIKNLASNIRDDTLHCLLLGFPIPKKIGDKNEIIHWQALHLPILTPKKGKIPRNYESIGRGKSKNISHYSKGFRSIEQVMWKLDKARFNPESQIEWLNSQNWDIDQIFNRGILPNELYSKKILIIGAGTVGSSIAELFVRSGITDITLIDNDRLEIGNLSRHPLGLNQIGKYKSNGMAAYLNQSNPHAKAESINFEFNYNTDLFNILNNHEVIIECTGEDKVIVGLSKFIFKQEKIFISISLGFGAKRLYLSIQSGKKFKLGKFCKKIAPWIEKEKDEISKINLPRDGIGCWSVIFPARYDDILLASSTSVKLIEQFVLGNEKELNAVYKQDSENGNIIGYFKVE